jgi:hypothetical protein
MSEPKTVQQMVRAITVRCSSPNCSATGDAAVTSSGPGTDKVIAPRGWLFGQPDPRSTKDVIYGLCPAHARP